MPTRWRQAVQSPNFWPAVGQMAAGLFIGFTILGYMAGKKSSPPYTDPTLGPAELVSYMRDTTATELGPVRATVDTAGRIQRIDRPAVRLVFVCSPDVYIFDIGARQVRIEPVTSSTAKYGQWMLALRASSPSLDVALGALLGGSGTTVAYNFRGASTSFGLAWRGASMHRRIMMVAVAASALSSGFAFGYWWAYEPAPRCGEASIRSILKEPNLWSSLWTKLEKDGGNVRWSFEWSSGKHLAAVNLNTKQILPPSSNSSLDPGSSKPFYASIGDHKWLICDVVASGDAELAAKLATLTSSTTTQCGEEEVSLRPNPLSSMLEFEDENHSWRSAQDWER